MSTSASTSTLIRVSAVSTSAVPLQHCFTSAPFRFSAVPLDVLFLAQIVYGSLEVLKTIKILIHAGESQVGDLIELP